MYLVYLGESVTDKNLFEFGFEKKNDAMEFFFASQKTINVCFAVAVRLHEETKQVQIESQWVR